MRSEESRLQLVRRFEEMKIAKGLKSVLKDAVNYTLKTSESTSHLKKQKQRLPMKTKKSSKSKLPHSSKKQHLHEGENRTEMAWSVHDSTKRRQRNGYWRVQVATILEKRT